MTEQPPPRVNPSTPIIDLVLPEIESISVSVAADLRARAEVGRQRYGVYLQAHNGRDALRDAYEEALDLVMYLRQHAEEAADPVDRRLILDGPFADAMNLARQIRGMR